MAFRFDDSEINILWPICNPTLSDRDLNAPYFEEIEKDL